jgi:hypothetical protein
MVTPQLISAYVPPEMKSRFRSLAEQRQMSESGLLRLLVDSAVRGVGELDAEVLKAPGRRLRGSRTCVRLHPDDKQLLSERAVFRQMAVATYISVLVRAHLRNLSPLPKAELMALKHSIAEVGAIGRNLNQLTKLAHQGMAGPTRGDLLAILKACEALRAHTKDLIKANTRSWEVGHADDQS